MANSAFVLSSGSGTDGRSVRATKTQTSHGFSAGSVIRFEQVPDGTTGTFKLASANSGISAEAIGIVESVSASGDEFTVVYSGEIDTTNFITNGTNGVTGSDVWFLDTALAGGLTATAPVSSGQIIKPVLTLVSGSSKSRGLVTNYLGTVIGGSNTVSLDSVHPVGEIIAFAGNTSDVPTGWQLCDGSTLDVLGDYADYYSRVGTKYGAQVEMVFTVTSGHTGFIGNTATQTVSSVAIPSLVMDWGPVGGGGTATILLDQDVLTGITGGETVGDNTGYPHGLIYQGGTNITVGTGGAANNAYSTSSATVKYVKTPDLRARTLVGATSDYVVPWSPRSSGMDGFTAGQIGGAEDADTVVVTSDGAQRVYAAKGATDASLRQPFMATHYIIRTTSTAQAALVDGLSVSLSDAGLTNHDTSDVVAGDINVYDAVSSNYKAVKLLDRYPADVANFENSFQIESTNGNISVGHKGGDHPLHVKNSSNAKIRIEDTTNSVTFDLFSDDDRAYTRTNSNHPLWLGTNTVPILKLHDSSTGYLSEFLYSADIAGNLGVTGTATIAGVTKFQAQAYSEIHNKSTGLNVTPNFNDSNVQKINCTGTTVDVKDPANGLGGGMYSLIFTNTQNSVVNFTWGAEYKWANGIKPDLIRANSEVIVSMVAQSASLFYCTWAEDFS